MFEDGCGRQPRAATSRCPRRWRCPAPRSRRRWASRHAARSRSCWRSRTCGSACGCPTRAGSEKLGAARSQAADRRHVTARGRGTCFRELLGRNRVDAQVPLRQRRRPLREPRPRRAAAPRLHDDLLLRRERRRRRFTALGDAIALARSELGVEIDDRPAPAGARGRRSLAEQRLRPRHVHVPRRDAGVLVYARTVMTARRPVRRHGLPRRRPDVPAPQHGGPALHRPEVRGLPRARLVRREPLGRDDDGTRGDRGAGGGGHGRAPPTETASLTAPRRAGYAPPGPRRAGGRPANCPAPARPVDGEHGPARAVLVAEVDQERVGVVLDAQAVRRVRPRRGGCAGFGSPGSATNDVQRQQQQEVRWAADRVPVPGRFTWTSRANFGSMNTRRTSGSSVSRPSVADRRPRRAATAKSIVGRPPALSAT